MKIQWNFCSKLTPSSAVSRGQSILSYSLSLTCYYAKNYHNCSIILPLNYISPVCCQLCIIFTIFFSFWHDKILFYSSKSKQINKCNIIIFNIKWQYSRYSRTVVLVHVYKHTILDRWKWEKNWKGTKIWYATTTKIEAKI